MRLAVLLQWWVSVAAVTANIVYITDLPDYSSLAPCAASAVSYAVQSLTDSACPQAVTALESCACTKDRNSAAVAATISSSVLYQCGKTATEDVASASKVFVEYCNQGSAAASTAAPSPTMVSVLITDLPAFGNLARCAASALSYVVLDLTNTDCPPAPSALASCACSKNQNSLAASESINKQVYYSCGSTHTEDVTSAQAVFAGYCGLNAGTTNFPTPSALAGSMTYYVTDLPQYSSLAPCAGSAVSSIILSQTNSYCGTAPDALASCVCVKDQNLLSISSALLSEVSYQCGSTAGADQSSAVGVLGYYCSAAKGQVTPTGIINSVAEASYGGAAQTAAQTAAGSGHAPTSKATSTTSAAPGASSDGDTKSGGGVKVGVLAGGIAGGVAIIIIAVVAILLYRRRRRQPPPLSTVGGGGGGGGNQTDSKVDVELHHYTKMSTPPLKPQNGMHEAPGDQTLGDHAISEMATPTSPQKYNKMYDMGEPNKQSPYEMQGRVDPVYEMQGRAQNPAYEMQGQQQHQAQEMPIGQPHGRMTYQSGPLFEMYAPVPTHSRGPSPH